RHDRSNLLRRTRFEYLEGRALLSVSVTSTPGTDYAANTPAILITGSGFSPIVHNDSVTLNSVNGGTVGCTVTAATATALIVDLTAVPTAGPLTAVVTSNGVSSGSAVTVATIAPVVTSSTVSLNASAGTLTINGYGFDSTTPSENTVTFNGAAVAGTVTVNPSGTVLTVPFTTAPTAGVLEATVSTDGVADATADVPVATVVPVV